MHAGIRSTAGGTHPTGMHSCCIDVHICFSSFINASKNGLLKPQNRILQHAMAGHMGRHRTVARQMTHVTIFT